MTLLGQYIMMSATEKVSILYMCTVNRAGGAQMFCTRKLGQEIYFFKEYS